MHHDMRILLTGAAGLIGGEVASRLVRRGHQVSALVHRNRDVRGNDGDAPALHALLTGDVRLPGLGLAPQEAADHDLLVHCAATTRFDLSDEVYEVTNVHGTANAVALAEAYDMSFLQVSTAYVCGARSGVIMESDRLPSSGFANGYEASKAAGENVVTQSSLRWAIARPGVVVGDSLTGAIRVFDTIYSAFKLIAEGRVRHMEASADATINFVPIDHVAAGIVALAEMMPNALGRSYHLVSNQPIPVASFAAAIGSYPQFTAPRLVPPRSFDATKLPAIERRLYGRVAGLYSSYFQRDPRFDDNCFRELTGLTCPDTGPAYLRRLIDYCVSVGFLSGGADHASRSRVNGKTSEASMPRSAGSR